MWACWSIPHTHTQHVTWNKKKNRRRRNKKRHCTAVDHVDKSFHLSKNNHQVLYHVDTTNYVHWDLAGPSCWNPSLFWDASLCRGNQVAHESMGTCPSHLPPRTKLSDVCRMSPIDLSQHNQQNQHQEQCNHMYSHQLWLWFQMKWLQWKEDDVGHNSMR